MADVVTKVENMIVPEVMAPMIEATIEAQLKVSKIAKVDTTLQGRPGDTVTVPQYKYIGDAKSYKENEQIESTVLETSSTKFTIGKAAQSVTLTDEAIESGYGKPVDEAERQLGMSIAGKIDTDVVSALMGKDVQHIYKPGKGLSYDGVVDMEDVFNEEDNGEHVMYVAPHQVATLRKDPLFISADKYDGKVTMNGEIGRIGMTRIIKSRKIKKITSQVDSSSRTTEITAMNQKDYINAVINEDNQIITPEIGTYVKPLETAVYGCPMVKMNSSPETDKSEPAITIYLKSGLKTEPKREADYQRTKVISSKHYGVALTNTTKVVLGIFNADTAVPVEAAQETVASKKAKKAVAETK